MTIPAKILALAPMLRKEHGLHHTEGSRKALKTFAGAVFKTRIKTKLSRRQFAQQVGVSYFTIAHIELGENWPSIPTYIKICEVLGVPKPPLL